MSMYMVLDFPFPLKDRDLVVKGKMSKDVQGMVSIQNKAIEGGYPLNPDYVRIQDYEGGIIGEAEFLQKLPRVAELAVGDACTGSNPRAITPTVMEKLLKACYYDTEVDF